MGDVARLSLSMARGSARTYNVTHQTSGTDETPINVLNWTIRVTARDARNHLILSKLATVTNGPLGLYTFAVTHTDTLVSPGAYRVDIQRTDGGSETLMGLGTFAVTPEVLY